MWTNLQSYMSIPPMQGTQQSQYTVQACLNSHTSFCSSLLTNNKSILLFTLVVALDVKIYRIMDGLPLIRTASLPSYPLNLACIYFIIV